MIRPREYAFCGLFGAAALLLPTLFHLLHLGHVFMPMYLPLVALAFFVRPAASALTALLVPLLSGAVTGMPPFMPPVAPVMALELALMALMIGTLRQAVPRMPVWCLLALALAVGRIVNALLLYTAARVLELPAGFVAGISLLSGWPGLLLMLAVIPGLVQATGYAQCHPHNSGACNRSGTGECEDNAFLVKRGAESRERGRPRPQQRVLQKIDAPTSFGNQTAHRNHERPFAERARTPALPTAHTQDTR